MKTAKSLLRKNKEGDQFLALLNYRNTPSQATGTSPVQRFFNRRTRTLLPTSETLLKPKLNLEMEKEKLQWSQRRQKEQYDRHAKDLPPLEEGDAVRMKPFTLGNKKWNRATVTRRLDNRSYEVEANGTSYRRNRIHLKKTPDILQVPDHQLEGVPEPTPLAIALPKNPTPIKPKETEATQVPGLSSPKRTWDSASTSCDKETTKTRFGRVVKSTIRSDFTY